MLWAGPSALAFVVMDFLNPHDKPSGAILQEPHFAEEETGSEKERDLPEATPRMTWSRAATQPGWSEAKALVLTSIQSYLSADSHGCQQCIRLGEQPGIPAGLCVYWWGREVWTSRLCVLGAPGIQWKLLGPADRGTEG